MRATQYVHETVALDGAIFFFCMSIILKELDSVYLDRYGNVIVVSLLGGVLIKGPEVKSYGRFNRLSKII